MADIFISYASEDRERAKTLAHALESEGWTVWWDRLIELGRPFDDVIQENIDAAKCVLVLWTADSVKSKWVRSEASEAEERNTLVPVMLEETADIPLAFKLLQAAKLWDWEPGVEHAEYDKLLGQIRALVEGPAPIAGGDGARKKDATKQGSRLVAASKRGRRILLAFIVVPPLLAVAGAAALMGWHVPTRVEMALEVDRVTFSVAGDDPVPILARAASFKRLALEQLAKVEFDAASLEPTDPAGAALKQAQIGFQAQPLDRMSIEIEPAGDGAAGRLSELSVSRASTVAMEMRKASQATLTLHIDGQTVEAGVLAAQPVQLTVSNANRVSPAALRRAPRMRMRATPSEANPLMGVHSVPTGITLVLSPSRTMQLLADGGAPVRQLELLKQGGNGSYESGLAGPGTISYPGIAKEPVKVNAGTLLRVDGLRNATLSAMTIEPDSHSLKLVFRGTVQKIQSKQGAEAIEDLRLTWFDRLWYGSRSTLLFSIGVWVAGVAIGAWRLLREAR